MTPFGNVYHGRRVLLTGHTGFKGSWLTLWLKQLGAQVTGISLAPDTSPSHWELLRLDAVDDRRVDVRDFAAIQSELAEARPEIVFHLAAQSLVRRGYREPLETWSTNVMGTAALLEACRQQPSVRAVVVVTTDKCYENKEWDWGYRENDRLGGHDPYSASKAAAELVTSSHRDAFFTAAQSACIASARAGNVIGGGDWCEDRLIPDAVRAVRSGSVLEVRSPTATRPWQHVLEPVSGYLVLGWNLLEGRRAYCDAWNFGPTEEGTRSVSDVLTHVQSHWPALQWRVAAKPQLHEAQLLQVDSTKARRRLQWRPVWGLAEGIARTVAWYRAYLEAGKITSLAQLEDYVAMAHRAGLPWAA